MHQAVLDHVVPHVIDAADEDPLAVHEQQGTAVAERGMLSPRRTSTVGRWRSSVALSAARLALWSSREHREHTQELGMAGRDVATQSTLGLLRSAVDPQYREREMGDRWELQGGKHGARRMFIREAHEQSQQVSHAPSHLRQLAAANVVQQSPRQVRRSSRLQSKRGIAKQKPIKLYC